MFKNLRLQRYLLGFGIVATLITASAVKASAQSIIIINGGTRYHRRNHNPKVGNFIYGSPISTPIPVNPVTGHSPTPRYFSKPYRKRRIYNSTFTHPVLVNPKIIKDSRRAYPNRRRYYRQPASRIIINYPY